MAVRRTAYVHQTQPTPDPSEGVTIDVYVLWPEGQEARASQLLAEALAEAASQIGPRAS